MWSKESAKIDPYFAPLTDDQRLAIKQFQDHPPKYYAWFYKFYTKYIGNAIFFGIIAIGALMIIFNDAIFDVVKGMFFGLFGLVIWAATAKWYKHIYTKRYAKEHGMTIQAWNYWTKGLVLNV